MMESRRRELQPLSVGATTHPGLWLDKFIAKIEKGESEAKKALVEDVVGLARKIGSNKDYKSYFDRYYKALINWPAPVLEAKGETTGRLVVGLGANAVLENSITLHRTYGVPYIPGSALKGVASSYAARYLEDGRWSRSFKGGKTTRGEWQKLIFGDTDEGGLIIFFDALPEPGKWQLNPDVITVHHQEYYQGQGKPPADWDSPIPVPFVTSQGTFNFALGLVPLADSDLEKGKELLKIAFELLSLALKEGGVGAKTSVGYGRIELDPPKLVEPPPPERSPKYKKAEQLARAMKWNDAPQKMKEIALLWQKLPAEEKAVLLSFLKANRSKEMGHPDLDKKKVKKNPALKELMDSLRQ